MSKASESAQSAKKCAARDSTEQRSVTQLYNQEQMRVFDQSDLKASKRRAHNLTEAGHSRS